MAIPMSFRQPWPGSGTAGPSADDGGRSAGAGLVPAVVGVLAVAMEHARRNGELAALCEAVERTLQGAMPADPCERQAPGLPRRG